MLYKKYSLSDVESVCIGSMIRPMEQKADNKYGINSAFFEMLLKKAGQIYYF